MRIAYFEMFIWWYLFHLRVKPSRCPRSHCLIYSEVLQCRKDLSSGCHCILCRYKVQSLYTVVVRNRNFTRLRMSINWCFEFRSSPSLKYNVIFFAIFFYSPFSELLSFKLKRLLCCMLFCMLLDCLIICLTHFVVYLSMLLILNICVYLWHHVQKSNITA